jgi:radical SAM superfamily enzyme YgiQ (UPF0313 family)
MRVCLASAPTANDFADPELAESVAIRKIAEHAPLGILSLAAVLEREGFVPQIVDLNRLYYDCIRSEDYRNGTIGFTTYAARFFESLSCDVFGFSTICSSYPLTLRIARAVKKAHPTACIVLGGPQASVVDVPTMRAFGFIDFVVRGEAEESFPNLLESLAACRAHDDLPGLTYRRAGEIVRNQNATAIDDLDTLPFPAFHLYPYSQACDFVPLELGRGCPFACSFCSTNDFFRRRFRLKSPQRVIGEMKRIKSLYNITSFDLIHDMFTIDRKKVVAFCEAVLECGDTFSWGCSARTDCIDDDLIARMAQAGCRGIFFGIETGSARLQQVIHKGLDLTEAAQRIRCTDEHAVNTTVSLITGFPQEASEDLKDTVSFFMESLRYDHANPQLHLLAPLAETPIQTKYRESLVFDDMISDMSFQGWQQDPLDRQMIARYPDIFPNFYTVPTPHLDRQSLKELIEFLNMGSSRLRWLLLGLHQDSGDLLEVFTTWRAWREDQKGPYPDASPARYFASHSFGGDFLQFVRSVYLPTHSRARNAVSALIELEAACDPANPSDGDRSAEARPPMPDDLGGVIGFDVTPHRAKDVTVTPIHADYKRLVQCLRRKGRLDRVPSRMVTLAIRAPAGNRRDVIQLSPLSAKLLSLCDGRRTVAEIAARFSSSTAELGGVPAEAACVWGLELLRTEGLIALAAAPHGDPGVAAEHLTLPPTPSAGFPGSSQGFQTPKDSPGPLR